MAAAWYFDDLGVEQGPLTALELRRRARDGEIGPGTLVRKEAGGRWVLASKVRGLLEDAVIESTGGVEEPQTADSDVMAGFGSQTVQIPLASKQNDDQYAGTHETTPPPLPSTPSEPAASIPAVGRKAFIRAVRAQT